MTITREQFDAAYRKVMQDYCDEWNLGEYSKLDLDRPELNCIKLTAISIELLNRALFGDR